ncbi:hypothetical protein HG530_006264 [Fusarium avenaceum]|nr:hypothetical protein HG530_006264 [Fusarium avenaceum]
MDRQRWVSPAAHQSALLIIKDSSLAAQRLMDVVHGEGDAVVKALLVCGDRGNLLLDSRDLNLAASVDQRSKNSHKVGHRLLGSAAENTTVQIGTRAGDLD